MAAGTVAVLGAGVPGVVRRNTLRLALAQCIGWIYIQTMVSLGSVIAFHLTQDIRWSGIPLTLSGLASAFSAPVAGRLMDRFGRRLPLLGGLLLIGLGGIISGLFVYYNSFAGFLAGVIVIGLGTGATLLSRSAAADMYPPSRRAEGISLVVMGGAAGAVGGPFLLKFVSDWGVTLGVDSMVVPWFALLLLVLVGLIAIFTLRPDPRDIASNLAAYYPGEAFASSGAAQPARPLSVILRQYPVIVAISSTAIVQVGMAMFMSTAPLDMTLHGHADSVYGVITGHFFGMLGLSIFIGRIADRLGRRAIILAGALIFIAGALFTPLTDDPLHTGLGLFLVGLGWSLCYVAGNTMLADMTGPLERGRTLGGNDLLVGVMSAAATSVGGLLLGSFGYLAVGIIGSTLVIIPLILAFRLRESAPGNYQS